nr:probable serine/threonine-protein kinase DDB_G0282963 [Dermatophagoides farinae]
MDIASIKRREPNQQQNADANNNLLLATTAAKSYNDKNSLLDLSSTSPSLTTTTTISSSPKTIMSSLANKIMANHHHDFHPFISNHHHNQLHNILNHNNNGVIQQTKTSTTPKSLSLHDIYNNVPIATTTSANDFIINHGSQHSKSPTCENTQLVQLLKPFYNSMQIHMDKQQTSTTLISNDNSGANNLYLIDSSNQLSLLSQSNDYVNSLTTVLNSEMLTNHQRKSSNSDQLHYQQSTSSTTNPQIGSNSSSSYLNGYGGQSSSTSNLDHINNCSDDMIANNSSFSTGFHHDIINPNKANLLNPNNDSDVDQKPTKTTRGRKKSKRGPFICLECHKEFCNQSTLTKHMITHSDERKFVCPQCSKAFKRHDHLNGHMLTHREHKPYACDIDGCDKSYCDARSLRRHKEKHKENALQFNEPSHLTTTTSSKSTNDEKGNDVYQLPINASAHLQFLALQQKKIHRSETIDSNESDEKIISSNHNRHNHNDNNNDKLEHIAIEEEHEQPQEQDQTKLIANSSVENVSNSDLHINLSNENALLHQLLTSNHNHHHQLPQHQQEPQLADKSLMNDSSSDHRQSIIQNNSNNNLTVIKINDNYINVCENDSDNYFQTIFNKTKHSLGNKKVDNNYNNHNSTTITTLGDSKILDSNKIESSTSVECSLCLKKFETIDALNVHLMKLHHSNETTLKTNPFLFQQQLQQQPPPKLSSLIDHQSVKANELVTQPQNPNQTYELNMKNYEIEIAKNFANIYNEHHHHHHQQQQQHQIHNYHHQQTQAAKNFDDIFENNPQKTNDIVEFRNIFQHTSQHQQQNAQFLMTTSGEINDKHHHQMIGNNQLYQNNPEQQSPHIIVDEPHVHRTNYYPDNEISQPQQQQQQTKGLNEVMFSPITPVTPLKNSSQFTFEFSNTQPPQQPMQSAIQTDKNNVVVVNQTAKMDFSSTKSAIITDTISNYVQSLEQDFPCFDTEKNENIDLLQKSSTDQIEQIVNADANTSQNFVDHHLHHQSLSTTTKSNEPNNDVKNMTTLTSSSTFNNFDLPSTKLTSDLFNRRIQRNNCLNADNNNNNINRTRELLSIKQIAASLESFSQNYERNQQQQQQQMISHSYSVPTTPCQIIQHQQILPDATNGNHHHNDDESSSYQQLQHHHQHQQMSHHHSLPTTPIDHGAHHHHQQQHFTFNTDSIYHQQQLTNQQQVASMPNNSMDDTNHSHHHHQQQQQQQFNFIFPHETSTATTTATVNEGHPNTVNDNDPNGLIDSTRNFEITNCLDETNYTDFSLYNSTSKENIEQVFNLDQNAEQPPQSASSIQFNDNIINSSQPSNENQENVQNDYFAPSSSNPIEPFGYDLDADNTDGPSNDGCDLKSNIVQFITPPTEIIKEPIVIDTFKTDHQKNDSIMRDINDNYVIDEKKTEKIHYHHTTTTLKRSWNDNHPYPRIKSPNNFIKSLNKKLSALSNEYDNLSTITPPTIKKKRPRPEPLYIPPHVNTTFVYHSRLRSPRFWNGGGSIIKPSYHNNDHHISPPPYTPPPMLSPVRSGSGLFWKINNFNMNINNNSSSNKLPPYNTSQFFNSKKMISDMLKENQNMINEPMSDLKTPTTAYEPEYDIPTTDIQPHVNIGPQFQARIPTFNPNRMKMDYKSERAILLWSPTVLDNHQTDDETIDLYFKISCSMCVNGHGNNKEYAMHLLYDCHGDVIEAMAKLIQMNPTVNSDHPLYQYYYANHNVWTENEINLFQKSIFKYDKDFFLIADEIKTKSVKDCVQFYYLWKKNSIDHFKRLRILRRKRESMFYELDTDNNNNKNPYHKQNKLSITAMMIILIINL